MPLRTWSALLVLLTACASAPAPQAMPRSHAFASTPTSSPRIRLASAPMEPTPGQAWIGRADLDKARALLSQARKELEPRQWEQLDRELTAAERAFERFSRVARRSGQAAEVERGVEGLAQVRMKLPEIQRERDLANACGYRFVVGVRSKAHKEALFKADNTLDVVVMDWC